MVTRPISTRSNIPMMNTRLVSLNSPMDCPTIAGMMFRIPCGRVMNRVVCQSRSPSAFPASFCPGGTAAIPPRTFSAMYAELNSVIVIAARYSSSMDIDSGNVSGNMCLDMNSSVMSGTPRTSSMKPTQKILMNGSLLLRPSARSTPIGNEHTIPNTASNRFNISPPMSWVFTVSSSGMPGTPMTSINEIMKTASVAMKNVFGFPIAGIVAAKYPAMMATVLKAMSMDTDIGGYVASWSVDMAVAMLGPIAVISVMAARIIAKTMAIPRHIRAAIPERMLKSMSDSSGRQ